MKRTPHIFSKILMTLLLGVGCFWVHDTLNAQQPPTEKIPILMYHYIRDYHDQHDPIGVGLSVSPQSFERQIHWLTQHNYQSINPEQLADIYAGKIKGPAKPVVITFDDGYDDAYKNAMPILLKYHQTGTFYLISDFINQPRYLTSEQVQDMAKDGMTIGDHTVSHQDLRTLDSAKQYQQLADSKRALEALIGKPILDLCYPSGKYNTTTLALAQRIGYRTAMTTHYGVATATTPLLTLPRLRITDNTSLAGTLKPFGLK